MIFALQDPRWEPLLEGTGVTAEVASPPAWRCLEPPHPSLSSASGDSSGLATDLAFSTPCYFQIANFMIYNSFDSNFSFVE